MKQGNDCVSDATTPVLIPMGDVLAIINHWRSRYPEDIFPANGTSQECKSARMARHVCDGIASDLTRLHSPH